MSDTGNGQAPPKQDLRQRFERLAAQVGETARARMKERPHGASGQGVPHALEEDYWESLRDLFLRDVTGKGLLDVEHETREAFHFFTRDLDFTRLEGESWYRRYPLMGWRIFLAMAHRLSPPRRILFAIGTPLLWLGWGWYAFAKVTRGSASVPLLAALAPASLLFVLLVLELKDKLALKGDLEIARQIQFGLLPFEPYDHGGLSIRASMRPANTVGGDYFDEIDLGDGRLAVVVGDVAGKGMPAALLMALLQGSLRTLLTAGLRGSEAIARLNEHLFANIPANRLITLFYGEVDLAAGAIRYVNAGHNPPFLLRKDGSIEPLAATAVALGIVANAEVEAMTTPLAPGDRLLLYTDGITEAANPADEEYGEERLRGFLAERRGMNADELIDALLADVLAFCGRARPRDDMTLLLLGRE